MPTNLPFSAYKLPTMAGSIHNNFVRRNVAKVLQRCHKVAKNPSTFVTSVRPSVRMYHSGSHRTDFP